MQTDRFIDKIIYKGDYFIVIKETYDNRKTPIYYVFDLNLICIAQIKWYSVWRKFCLYPENENTIWDKRCLVEIVKLLDDITEKYNKEKKEKQNG